MEIPNKVRIMDVVLVVVLANAKESNTIFRIQSDSTSVVIEQAEMEGIPRTNIATLVHDMLISSLKTRPRTNARYAGRN